MASCRHSFGRRGGSRLAGLAACQPCRVGEGRVRSLGSVSGGVVAGLEDHVLSKDQVEEFEHWGLTRLPNAISAGHAAAMCDSIWSFLRERDAIEQARPDSWPVGPVAQFQRLSRSAAFESLGRADRLTAAVDDLIGIGQWRLGPSGVLVTFPQHDVVWAVPTSAWHLDAPPQNLGKVVGVRVFVILEELRAHGGGTLVLAGSHRLVNRYLAISGPNPRSGDIKSRLGSAHPWLAGLWGRATSIDVDTTASSDADAFARNRRYMDEGAIVDDVPVVVREVHGATGDVFLMHADCFHASAPNCRERPRIMLASSGVSDSTG
jgi:hypothetical protein